MGPGIVIPVVVLVIAVPVGLLWARRRFTATELDGDDVIAASGTRITSNALRGLPSPPWRVVYEIAADRLGGVEHVLIGPSGIYAVRTSMEALPTPPDREPTAQELAAPAIARGELDDALRRCAMSSDRLLVVHWGRHDDGAPVAVEPRPGEVAVDGRRLHEWASDQTEQRLTASQIDLAWQTVTTAIGRPDPLA